MGRGSGGRIEADSAKLKAGEGSCDAQFRLVRNELSQHMHNLDDTIFMLTKNYDQFQQGLIWPAEAESNTLPFSDSRFRTAVTDSNSTRKASYKCNELSPLNTDSHKTNAGGNLLARGDQKNPHFFQKGPKLESWGKDNQVSTEATSKAGSRLSAPKSSMSTKRSLRQASKKETHLSRAKQGSETNE
jgi:hypothetical protein